MKKGVEMKTLFEWNALIHIVLSVYGICGSFFLPNQPDCLFWAIVSLYYLFEFVYVIIEESCNQDCVFAMENEAPLVQLAY